MTKFKNKNNHHFILTDTEFGVYNERYRKSVLENALRVYDFKVKEDLEGVKPLNGPSGYRKKERRKEKKKKKQNWATSGGHTAPIIIPATPGGELARRLRKIAEEESVPGVSFKVVERGGKTLAKTKTMSISKLYTAVKMLKLFLI